MNSLCHSITKRWPAKSSLPLVLATSTTVSLLGITSQRGYCFHQKAGGRTLYMKHMPVHQIHRPWHETKSRALFSSEACAAQEPVIHSVYEEKTGTWQYVVADPSSQIAVIIDPVLDYDPATQVVSTQTADSLLSMVKEKGYKIDKVLETHAHADHLTAASYLQDCLAGQQGHKPPICIGKRIGEVQRLFGKIYNIPAHEYNGVFDKLFDDDETFDIGKLTATIVHLPGHTPDHIGYKIGGNVFCGDSIFHTDIGTARCDFPGGSPDDLYNSARKLLALPDETKIWSGHDYPSDARGAPVPWLSVKDHKKNNAHLHDNMNKADFVTLRQTRDTKLGEPKLLHQSLQINIRAGRIPKPTASGLSLLHLPLKLKNVAWEGKEVGV
ncbi:metallo-beta-lactamase superfamily protein [Phlyctema vagabunda]|uniref:Metallo-beta-lactamase superfamily protein n=1 Tax=Phlyctema vagabunda TaxID=108571 RepID=A0ABR4P2A1_9HELO